MIFIFNLITFILVIFNIIVDILTLYSFNSKYYNIWLILTSLILCLITLPLLIYKIPFIPTILLILNLCVVYYNFKLIKTKNK